MIQPTSTNKRPASKIKVKPTKLKLKNALTVANIQNQNIERIEFTGEWLAAFGKPQNRGLWFVWGGSGSGKSTFQMMLSKQLATVLGKVTYNLLEEETDDADYIERTELCMMNEVEENFHTVSYNLQELDQYLRKPNRPKAIVIDSLPYLTKNWDEWYAFKKYWSTRLVIIATGHAKGKNPKTDFEDRVMFDAKMKIFITGYLAVCKGRTIGANGGTFIIYQEGCDKLRGATENK